MRDTETIEQAHHSPFTYTMSMDKGFTALQNHIFVGICDEDCCSLALDVLRAFMDGPLGLDVLTARTFAPSLKLLHQMEGREADLEALLQRFPEGMVRVLLK